jgi:hypothetical protein
MILIMIGSSQDLDMRRMEENNHLATAMDPWSRGGLLTHHSEAGMVMKKASDDDSPLRQGARKSF